MSVRVAGQAGEEAAGRKVFLRGASVFDVSQTDPPPGKEPVPLTPPAQPITGDGHGRLSAPLIHAAQLGYTCPVQVRAEPSVRCETRLRRRSLRM
jgi:hypothetical protein